MKFISVVSIDTGEKTVRRNDELKGQRYMVILKQLLETGETLALPDNEHISCEATVENRALLLMIKGPKGPHVSKNPYVGETMPLMTVAISRHSRHGIKLWSKVCDIGDNPLLKRPMAPWCARLVHETAVLLTNELDRPALDEYIDGLSLAWLQYRKQVE